MLMLFRRPGDRVFVGDPAVVVAVVGIDAGRRLALLSVRRAGVKSLHMLATGCWAPLPGFGFVGVACGSAFDRGSVSLLFDVPADVPVMRKELVTARRAAAKAAPPAAPRGTRP